MTTAPDRLWKECSFDAEGRIRAAGEGTVELFDRFTISANGLLVEVVVIGVSTDRTWRAQDARSFDGTVAP